MHDGMLYDSIQDQRHEPFKSGHFQQLSPPLFTMSAGN